MNGVQVGVDYTGSWAIAILLGMYLATMGEKVGTEVSAICWVYTFLTGGGDIGRAVDSRNLRYRGSSCPSQSSIPLPIVSSRYNGS